MGLVSCIHLLARSALEALAEDGLLLSSVDPAPGDEAFDVWLLGPDVEALVAVGGAAQVRVDETGGLQYGEQRAAAADGSTALLAVVRAALLERQLQ